MTGDWTLFTRFKELNLSGSVLTLFAGETDSQLVINSSSKELGYYDSDGGNGFVGIGYFATNLLDNQWHDVAVVRSNGVLSYFVDGLIVGTVADSNSTYLQWLGGKTGNDSFSRSIDDFRYFHRALSATEIAAVSRDDEAIPIHPAYYDNSPYFLNAIGHSHNQEVQLTYSLLDDANGRFAIHPTGGAITIPNRSDPVFVGSHTIAIQVTDREGVSSVRRITIQIVPFHPQAGSMFVSQVFLAAGGDTTVGPLAGFTLPLPLTAYQSDWIAAPELSDRLIPVYSTTNPSVIERVIVNGPLTSAHVGKMALVRHWYESIDGGETRITETEFHIVPTLEPPSLAPNVTLFEPRFDSSKR